MLGVPPSPGVFGGVLLGLGVVVAAFFIVLARARLRSLPPATAAAGVCLVVTVAAAPYLIWHVAEDVRHTGALSAYDAAVAGPVQAYLQPYLLDGVPRLVPRQATYATVVSGAVPYAPARAAFPALALQTLFPRRSVRDPRQADYVVSWGVRPEAVTPVRRVWRVRARSGPYPAVYVGMVAR